MPRDKTLFAILVLKNCIFLRGMNKKDNPAPATSSITIVLWSFSSKSLDAISQIIIDAIEKKIKKIKKRFIKIQNKQKRYFNNGSGW